MSIHKKQQCGPDLCQSINKKTDNLDTLSKKLNAAIFGTRTI